MAARDVIFIVAVVFILSISFLVFSFTARTMFHAFAANPTVNATGGPQVQEVMQSSSKLFDRMDWALFAIFIGLLVGLLITSWLVPTHPVFMLAYFLIAVVGVVLSTVLSKVWEVFINNTVFVNTTYGETLLSSFPVTNFLISYYPLFITVVAFAGIVVMFAKPQRGDQ